jgi:hypothetical protein
MQDERFNFEELKVYQKALEYVEFVYNLARKFPKTEVFSLVDQFKSNTVHLR